MRISIMACSLLLLLILTWINLEYVNANEGIRSARWKDCKNHLLSEYKPKLTASSVYSNYSNFQPENAVLLFEKDKGASEDKAWCPNSQIMDERNEWIQVEFDQVMFIMLIFMSGRGNINYAEYVTEFFLRYQREDNGPWLDYKTFDGKKIMKGNSDPRNLERQYFLPPLVAKRLRFYPYDRKTYRSVCLRFEFFGCEFNDGVISYNMPQGTRQAFDSSGRQMDPKMTSANDKIFYFEDDSYDGKSLTGGLLSDGMGQLMDDFTLSLSPEKDTNPRTYAYNYVGWRRNSENYITITFAFNAIRKFRTVKFHSFNQPDNKYSPFSKVEADFSVGGDLFSSDQRVVFSDDFSSNINHYVVSSMPLRHRIGRFVRLKLYFHSDWMILSEITFDSEIVKTTVATEISVETKKPLDKVPTKSTPSIVKDNTRPLLSEPTGSPNATDRSAGNILVFLFITILLFLVLIVSVAFIWRWRRRHVQRKKIKCKMADSVQCTAFSSGHGPAMTGGVMWGFNVGTPVHSTAECNGSFPFNHYSVADRNSYGLTQYVQNGAAGSSQQPLLKDHHNSMLYNNVVTDDEEADCLIPNAYTMPTTNLRPSPEQVPIEYASTTLFSSPSPGFRSSQPPPIAPPTLYFPPSPFHPALSTNGSISSGGVNEVYQTPSGITESRLGSSGGCGGGGGASGSSCYESTGNFTGLSVHIPALSTAFPKICNDAAIQGVTGSSVYAWSNGCATNSNSSPNDRHPGPGSHSPLATLPKLQLNSFTLVERLGGGQFGEVHLAEVNEADIIYPPDFMSTDERNEERRLVAIKMLRKDAAELARKDFESEVRMLIGLCDPNLAGVYGVCVEGGSLSVIVEYTKHGDLHYFLRTRRHIPTFPGDCQQTGASPMHIDMETTDNLSFGCLIYLAVQVASGMKYLESLGLVHRDLACRNCLVGPRFSVKISDLGMCRRVYATDYCRIEGRAPLPIRWMSWEAIIQGRFTTKSDVWSFATTLWEMLTLCRQQPLDHLSNEQVLDNSVRCMSDQPARPYDMLSCPALCTKEIYDLMLECWQRSESQRPTFREIHMFLQRKNLGFNADQEYQMARITNLLSTGSCLH